jgi:hypothetical protein
MDDILFNQRIESVIFPHYLNTHKKTAVLHERTGKLNRCPVFMKVDAGPERFVLTGLILVQRAALF